MIVNQSLCNLTLPEDAAKFYRGIAQISSFDFYDTNDFINTVLNLESTKPFNDSFKEFGYTSVYAINNMGTMIIFYVIYPVLVIIEICLK